MADGVVGNIGIPIIKAAIDIHIHTISDIVIILLLNMEDPIV
jgi:hypothetical protein